MKWTVAAISKFCKTGSGGTPLRLKAERYYGGHIPWVKSGELYADFISETEEYITDEAIAESSAKLVPAGTLLVAMYGATVGQTAILGVEAATNQAICHIVPDERIATVRYIWYSLRFKLPELLSRRIGGAQPNISQQIIRNTLIFLPPISEQRRIVEILAQADALRKKRAEADAKAERILPALFIRMFGDPVTNTMGWEAKTLAAIETDFRYGTSVKCDSEPNGLPVLRIPNILHGEIDTTDIKYAELPSQEVERLLLQEGDLLFVRTNGNPDYVGRCAIFDSKEPYLYASYLIRTRLNPDKANPWFVAACLRTPSGRKLMAPFIRTTAGQSNISVEGLKQISIPLPPIEKQRQFRTQVENFYKLRRAREKARDLLETTFHFLLQRAFSGELTAKWREAHMTELLAEMEQQAKILGTTAELDYEQLTLIETQ